MSFPTQMAGATVVVAGAIAGLVWLGRKNIEEERAAEAAQSAEPAPAESAKPQPAAPARKATEVTAASPDAFNHATRSLVPASAWLVADFRGDLTGNLPFGGTDGLCSKVPAPSRVALALLPPVADTGPVLLLAASSVEETFWGCARDRIIRAGGIPIAENDQFQVLKSPSGVVARGPQESILFVSEEKALDAALAALSRIGPSAADAGPHPKLFRRMHKDPEAQLGTALDLTWDLPKDWLSSVGDDAKITPLRHATAAFLSLSEDGSAQGGIDCEESGCAEMLAFLNRAREDMSKQLPPGLQKSVVSSLKAEHLKGSGRIALSWSPQELRLQDLMGKLLGGGPLIP